MRIFKQACAVLLALTAVAASAAAAGVTFRSPEDALKQGISAYNGGFYEIAVPALEAVKTSDPVLARYYLARIYADNEGAYTDHPKAYQLFRGLADDLGNVDADDDNVAPIAAASLTALSSYLRRGLPEAKLVPNVDAADRALQKAALFFNNEDAQFELAKVLLRGEGPDISMGSTVDPSSKIEIGRHWLSRLSRKGHPGAQAFLADLLWRGKFVTKDQPTALNLIDVALANAPPHERVWIADIYQNIYCNAGEGVRQQATGRVADWHERYGRSPVAEPDHDGLADLSVEPERACANGEPVVPMASSTTLPRTEGTAAQVPGSTPLTAPSFAPPASPKGTDAGFTVAPPN